MKLAVLWTSGGDVAIITEGVFMGCTGSGCSGWLRFFSAACFDPSSATAVGRLCWRLWGSSSRLLHRSEPGHTHALWSTALNTAGNAKGLPLMQLLLHAYMHACTTPYSRKHAGAGLHITQLLRGVLVQVLTGNGEDCDAFDSMWLLRFCTRELLKARKSDKPSAAVIAGATAGLASALSVGAVSARSLL